MNKDVRLYSLNLLVKREYTVRKLNDKITKRFEDVSEEEIKEVFDWLQEKNYLSDSRYAELFVRQKIRTADGPSKIKQKLYEKGVSADIIAEALSAYQQDDQHANAITVGTKKYRILCGKETDVYKRRAKLQNFLAARGFGMDVISRAVSEIMRS